MVIFGFFLIFQVAFVIITFFNYNKKRNISPVFLEAHSSSPVGEGKLFFFKPEGYLLLKVEKQNTILHVRATPGKRPGGWGPEPGGGAPTP